MRIVSLLPSATEIVCALGLGEELVGVTHECDWPPDVIGKTVVTRDTQDLHELPSGDIHALVSAAMHGGSSLYALDDEKLEALEPDLILTQELCRVCAVSYHEVNEVARAIDASITVVSLEPTSIEGILNTITTVGAMAEVEDDALDLVESLRSRLGAVEELVTTRRDAGRTGSRVVAVEWLDPTDPWAEPLGQLRRRHPHDDPRLVLPRLDRDAAGHERLDLGVGQLARGEPGTR